MTSEAPYLLVVLGTDDVWAEHVIDSCAGAIARLVGRDDALAIERALPDQADPAEEPPHSLVVFLADGDSRVAAELIEQVERAREQFIATLPVVRSGSDVFAVLPDILRPLNAVEWKPGDRRIGREVARLLGLSEAERRLFLSYRRMEASSLAVQLRERMSQRCYDVFLDRFSVPPAEDFQRRINIELADKAFILLLESPSAVGSQWVQHEVAYGLSHGISLLALCLPGTRDQQRFQAVDETFRLRLGAGDLQPAPDPVGPDDRVLAESALEEVLEQIEDRYARQLRRRRVALLGSLEQWLNQASREPQPVRDEWALAANDPAAIFMITPRAPSPRDLRKLDELRAAHPAADNEDITGYLLFAAPIQDSQDERLVDWIIARRPLSTHPHITTPDLLGL